MVLKVQEAVEEMFKLVKFAYVHVVGKLVE
jgi:hypothetical protein